MSTDKSGDSDLEFVIDTSGIKQLVKKFDDEEIKTQLDVCNELHRKFLAKWPIERLKDILTLETFAIGKGDTDNFCYWVERETRPLGSILGAPAIKFKVFFDKKGSKYKWVKGYKSADEAFLATKDAILSILEAAEKGNFNDIKANKVLKNSHMFRGKILYLYYPNKFLNVFAEDDIDFLLERLGIEFNKHEHIVDKQAKLIQLKNNCIDMVGWSNLKFGYFLWSQFVPPSKARKIKSTIPSNKKTNSIEDILAEEGAYVLPKIESTRIELIDFGDIKGGGLKKGKDKNCSAHKIDYITESIRNKKLGDQGEEIVMKYETQCLKEQNRQDLADKVDRVSLKDDSLGYDILSFSPNGKVKYIDVKATKSGIDRKMPFYLTENEKTTMDKNRDKYYLYRVFSANTTMPDLPPVIGPLVI